LPLIAKSMEQFDDECPQAGVVLPMQFHGDRRGTAITEPLRRLMVAMLVDAIRCFQTKVGARQPAKRREFVEVRSWIFSDKDNRFFSFGAVCEALEIDPKAIRKELVHWADKKLASDKPQWMIWRWRIRQCAARDGEIA
jgi:hypothetical protein